MNITYILGFIITPLRFFKIHILNSNNTLIKNYDIINLNGEEIYIPYYNLRNDELKKSEK